MVRRGVTGAAVLGAVILALTGCAKPAGVDGNLTNGWPLPPEPTIAVPTAPACYNVPVKDPVEVQSWPAVVSCTTRHTVETISVGAFQGTAADRTSPPPAGGPDRRDAFARCTATAHDYLGADWRTGRIGVFLVIPSDTHWEAGARWYRCDVMAFQDVENSDPVVREAPLKDGLVGSSDLRLTCGKVTSVDDAVAKVASSSCSVAHNGEFAGLYDHPDGTYSTDSAARSKANLDGCRTVVAAYTGLTVDNNYKYRVGQVATPFTKAYWELGNRSVRCFVWTPKDVTTSVKGVGVGGLPINYA
jgi:hypothetical protein